MLRVSIKAKNLKNQFIENSEVNIVLSKEESAYLGKLIKGWYKIKKVGVNIKKTDCHWSLGVSILYMNGNGKDYL